MDEIQQYWNTNAFAKKKKKRIECHKESKAIFSNIYSIVTEISCFLS